MRAARELATHSTTVIVILLDVNDNVPVFDLPEYKNVDNRNSLRDKYFAAIPYDSEPFTFVMQLEVGSLNLIKVLSARQNMVKHLTKLWK